jgi:hypothetical protein
MYVLVRNGIPSKLRKRPKTLGFLENSDEPYTLIHKLRTDLD